MKEAFVVYPKERRRRRKSFRYVINLDTILSFSLKVCLKDVFWCGDMDGLVSGRISNSQVRLPETDLIFEIKFVLFIWSS